MTTIEHEGLVFEVRDTVFGAGLFPLKPEAEALAWLLNDGARGRIADLEGRIQRREEISTAAVFAVAPDPDETVMTARDRWIALTGADPGDDAYVVGVVNLPIAVQVPRSFILALWKKFQDVRRSWSPEPVMTPTPDRPVATVRAVNEPFHVPDAELADLERRAAELDTLDATARTEGELATVAARRRMLLIDLAHAGILDDDRGADKDRLLSALGRSTLVGYRRASARLLAYLASGTRRGSLPPLALTRLHSAPVSVDWFRREQPTPDGFTADEWLAWCELGFSRMSADLTGGGGDAFTGGGGRSARLFWRRDDGVTPCLVRAQLRPARR